ncbi:hypothetical protein CDD82_3726 [Ophiocordyceps australis]|uniref:Alpha/beta hydrolase fold-3 domain-containing protein n=1 Tax=Ophiocordyceps australis TaxID=1399860 RepID=A0A2C5YY88_9HYPO|nr:hypothetical protein CDD82_3726 [Ophiocordyceps australis]
MSETPQGHEALQPIHASMKGRLDAAFEALYNQHVAKTPAKPIDLKALRSTYSQLYSYGTGPGPDVGRVYDAQIPLGDGGHGQLDVRVYEPAKDQGCEGPWPVHVDFHGGGWAVGDLDTEAHICRHMCSKARVVVIDVGYRLVPEHPYPTGITDSLAALRFVHSEGAAVFNIRPDSISVGGVSAGGFIALALAHLARDAKIALRLVAAGTPVIDDVSQYKAAAESPFASMRENEMAPTLNWARLVWFDGLKWSWLPSDAKQHQAERQRIGWLANLLRAPDYVGLARTVIYTAGADPLRDEGERYGQLLVEAGVPVTMRRFPGVPHPFMHMDKHLWQAREYINGMAREIRLAHWDEQAQP